MALKRPREKSFATKEAFIKWMNLKDIEILDIYAKKQKLTIIYRDVV
jgi:hypothetical protein